MDIITRNFFQLVQMGVLDEHGQVEPMSAFKWRRLGQMVHVQHVERQAVSGLDRLDERERARIPKDFIGHVVPFDQPDSDAMLSNRWLNSRLRHIREKELHAIDINIGALDVLSIIVSTVSSMLNHGTMLRGILQLGSYLREKGDKVDFVKLDNWLKKLHLRRMAQLEGSMLIVVFHFEKDELPFVSRVEPNAYRLVLRSVAHTANDTAEEWHFRQNRSGFVTNNSTLLRRNLRRSLRYVVYAPIETISNYFNNFARSLQEIEE